MREGRSVDPGARKHLELAGVSLRIDRSCYFTSDPERSPLAMASGKPGAATGRIIDRPLSALVRHHSSSAELARARVHNQEAME